MRWFAKLLTRRNPPRYGAREFFRRVADAKFTQGSVGALVGQVDGAICLRISMVRPSGLPNQWRIAA